MSKFLTFLTSTEIDERKNLHLLERPLVYVSDLMQRTITAPSGFITDFASVPRVLGIYDLEGGKYNRAAVIHDLLYTGGSCGLLPVDRATADAVLKEAITASGGNVFDAYAFYSAVRVGGASHWTRENVTMPADVLAAIASSSFSPYPA